MGEREEKRLQITQAQAALLARRQAEADAARERMLLVAEAILAGHGLTGGELVHLDTDADPPVLVVRA